MATGRRVTLPAAIAVVCAAVVLLWGTRHPPGLPAAPTPTAAADGPTRGTAAPPAGARAPPPDRRDRRPTLRERFHAAKDYAAFVAEIHAAAAAGDPAAEFLAAKALKYCDESLQLFFRTTAGRPRSLTDAQRHWANRPPSFQQQIAIAYERCHAYAQDPSLDHATDAWGDWLAKAAAAGFAPAQAQQAAVWQLADMLSGPADTPPGQIAPQTWGRARDLALTAVLSADPEAIVQMQNWVDGNRHPPEDYAALTGAWQLLACQRGYDGCGPGSDWLLVVCTWDPQCAPDDAGPDYLRRQFGSRFDEVQSLANAIGAAVDAGNQAAIESFL
jgi:hypothetical protein